MGSLANKKQTCLNNPLFRYIKPYNNDLFSKMNGRDLQDLLYYVDNYYLELRNRLGFDDYITFGLELEFENANINNIEKNLSKKLLSKTWKLDDDFSLKNGAEIDSPILQDNFDSWNNLKKVCSVLEKNASIGSASGGHIHVGTQVIGKKTEFWLNFIKLWSVYENVIYRFAYGEYSNARSSMNLYAEPLANNLWKDYKQLKKSDNLIMEEVIKKISHKRCQAINFNNVYDYNNICEKNTIEFRCPNGSIDPIIWQNNVNLFVNILLYSKSTKYDNDIIQNRKKINENKYSKLCWYNEIYLQQALELGDMLFVNNIDKVYFLRQYLKSFIISDEKLAKAKTFTKK